MELNRSLSEARRKRQRYRLWWYRAVVVVAGIIVIGFFWWLIYRSPLVRVRQIVVQGNTTVTSSTIISLADQAFAQHHHFFMPGIGNMLGWPSSIPANIIAQQPALLGATISKSYAAHTITISVTERQPFALWCLMPAGENTAPDTSSTVTATGLESEDCNWFDTAGVLFEPGFDTEGDLISVVHDYSQSNLALGNEILPVRFLPNMISILNVIRESNLRVEEIRLNDLSLEEVDVTTYNGPTIEFSLRFPADDTLVILKQLMSQPGFDNFQYVDFRTQDRAYYK